MLFHFSFIRWSSDDKAGGVAGLPGLGAAGSKVIPGMPVNLSQEQIQETLVLQMRLQQVREKTHTERRESREREGDSLLYLPVPKRFL